MAEYTFDGTTLRDGKGTKMGEIDRSYIRGWNAALLGQLDRKNIRDPRGKKLLEFDGKTVKDDLGKKVTTIKEIQELIDGEADISLVAAWYFLIKKQQANMT
ncbi:hypothetical protein [Marispirochaeta aestuarii]|nr:hypothetical protein [Marispirochaeta aestuarii]